MKNDEIERLDFSGWPLPDECLIELGRVAALWARLESFLNICIGKLAGFNDLNDPKPFILVNHASVPQKIDMLSTICEQLAPEFRHLQDYAAVVSQMRAAQRSRNLFLHNGLSLDTKNGELKLAEGSARGTLKTRVASIRIADIRRASVDIHLANLALYKLVLRREVAPIWERPGSPNG
jgi:hypothetical protein